MSAMSPILRDLGGGQVAFRCPGCKSTHSVMTGEGPGPRWGYNGNPDAPTFTPSILVRAGHFVPGQEGKRCWCDYIREHPEEAEEGFRGEQCHSFVTDGKIQFLDDCSHDLKGQTVALSAWDG